MTARKSNLHTRPAQKRAAGSSRKAPVEPPQGASPDSLEWGGSQIDAEPVRTSADPARAAIRLMLARALDGAGVDLQDAARDGALVVILVPEPAWVEPALKEWKWWARRGQRCQQGGHQHSLAPHDWVAWSPMDAPSDVRLHSHAEGVAVAVAAGQHCVGFSATLDWLPADLVQAADHTLTLPGLTGADVADVARELCGGVPHASLTDAQAGALTPRLLRLARRPGQAAGIYIAKLAELLLREAKQEPQTVTRKPREISPRSAPALERLHGMAEATAWGMAVARDIAAYRRGDLPWSAVDRGCLLSGPPGVGKTIFARALATSCRVPLVTGSYGQWMGQGGHQGSLLTNMRKAFEKAYSHDGAVLFIDEIDAFTDRATVTREWSEWHIQAINTLLELIDGADAREGVIVLGACNHPERLDPALVRSGRLDRHISIGIPDRAALAAILREHLDRDLLDADLSEASLAAVGSTGADCEFMVRGARRRARNAGRPMEIDDLLAEVGGEERRSPDDLRLAALHEAGHAIALLVLRPGALEAVALRDGDGRGGRTSASLHIDQQWRLSDVRETLTVILAGRAAEELCLGCASSGAGGTASSDLARATELAARAESAYGLDPAAGLAWRGDVEAHRLPQLLAADQAMAFRVRERLDEAHAAALALLSPRVGAIRSVAAALLDRRVLDGVQARAAAEPYLAVPGVLP